MIGAALRDSVVYGIASVLSRGLALVVLPIYTRVLAPGEFGAFDLIITFGVMANLIVSFEVGQGLARYWAETPAESERRRLAGSAWWFSICMYGLFLGLAWSVSPWINERLLGDSRWLAALRIGLLFIAVNGLFFLLQNQFRWELRTAEFAVVSVLYSATTLGGGALFGFVLGWGLEGVLLGQLVAAALSAVIAWWRLRRSFACAFDGRALRKMLAFSAPLVPAGLATFVNLYVSRLALNAFSPLADVGVFAIAARLSGAATLIIVGVQGALTPLIYQHYRKPETPRELATLFEWFVAAALLGCLAISLFAPLLLDLFATEQYAAGAPLVAVLAPAALMAQMYVFAPGMVIRKKTQWQLAVATLAAVASAGSSWVLVPQLGIHGAAMANLAGATVLLVTWFAVSQRLYAIPVRWGAVLAGVLAYIATVAAGLWLDSLGLGPGLIAPTKVLLGATLLGFLFSVGLLPKLAFSAGLGMVRRRLGGSGE